MGWLKSKGIQKLGGGFLERFGIRSWSRLMMTALSSRKDDAAMKLIRQIFRDNRSLNDLVRDVDHLLTGPRASEDARRDRRSWCLQRPCSAKIIL